MPEKESLEKLNSLYQMLFALHDLNYQESQTFCSSKTQICIIWTEWPRNSCRNHEFLDF